MIYVDTSVALAHVLSETRRPPDSLWQADLAASRLVAYECWTRLHAMNLGKEHGEALRRTLGHLALLEMVPVVLARALDPFPTPVRTLDALHLASVEFLRAAGEDVSLATYDRRLAQAARALGIECFEP